MALDRQSIEKRDFPIGRRGYDAAAVDAHLAQIATEVEELRAGARRHTESLASSASEQVRGILEAAEASAAEIVRRSEAEARELHAQAAERAREYVGRVSEATTVMLQRLAAMESELVALLDGLRTGANRLNADLQLLEGNFESLRGEVVPSVGGPLATDVAAANAEDAAAIAEAAAADPEDAEGARLVALNMALNGTPREETERYLSENFALEDRERLLDEVYASLADGGT